MYKDGLDAIKEPHKHFNNFTANAFLISEWSLKSSGSFASCRVLVKIELKCLVCEMVSGTERRVIVVILVLKIVPVFSKTKKMYSW